MSDDKPKAIDDLKQGLGLLFRAAKSAAEVAAEKMQTGKVEDVARDAVREVGRALETVGGELDKVWSKATGSAPPPAHDAPPPSAHAPVSAPPTQGSPEHAKPYDDAYAAPPPADDGTPRGPRVG